MDGAVVDHTLSSSRTVGNPSSSARSKRRYAEELLQAFRVPPGQSGNVKQTPFLHFDETAKVGREGNYICVPQIDNRLEWLRQWGTSLIPGVLKSESRKRRRLNDRKENNRDKCREPASLASLSAYNRRLSSRYNPILHKSSPLINSMYPGGREYISEFDMPNKQEKSKEFPENLGDKLGDQNEPGKPGLKKNNLKILTNHHPKDLLRDVLHNNQLPNHNIMPCNDHHVTETPIKNSKSFGGLLPSTSRHLYKPDRNSNNDWANSDATAQDNRRTSSPIIPNVTYGTRFILQSRKPPAAVDQRQFGSRLQKALNGTSPMADNTSVDMLSPLSTIQGLSIRPRVSLFPSSDDDDDILKKLQEKRKEIYEEERRRAAASNKGTVEIVLPDEPVKLERAEYYKKISDGRKTLQEQIERLKLGDEYDEGLNALDDVSLQKVKNIWAKGRHLEGLVLGTAFKIDITVRDLKTLCDGQWLNDNIIDFYLNLVAEKSSATGKKYKSFSFSTHFYTTLEGPKGYQGVARWAKRQNVNVTELDFIIIPINRNQVHWCLAVVNNRQKRFEFYDSLSGDGWHQLHNIREYMVCESDRLYPGKHEEHVEKYDLYQIISNVKCPQQTNGSDCGVFTCKMAELLSQGKRLAFSQADMRNIRQRMTFEILKRVS